MRVSQAASLPCFYATNAIIAGAGVYIDREEVRRGVFDCIKMSYKAKRRHGYADRVSPVQFKQQCFNRLKSV